MTLDDAARLIQPGELNEGQVEALLGQVGFRDWRQARQRLDGLCPDEESRRILAPALPMLLLSLSETATPDGSLINFERFVQSVPDRADLFAYLAENPRAVEILIKLFVGSQFLTEILLRNTGYLEKLTRHKRLAEFKSRPQFVDEAKSAASGRNGIDEKLDALRRYQHWELLRIGACDSFGLFDLKSVTLQLSLLADSMVQCALALLADELNVPTDGFVVLAFGKLGGEELNYSSDVDLVFLAERDATRFWGLGQRLIKALRKSTAEGFLYRVDMRLRPWGRSGALVNTLAAHRDYLRQHGMAWEKQALLKARPIAGDLSVGARFLQEVRPIVYGMPGEEIRKSIRRMKRRIESDLQKRGRGWGEVKLGTGSIRDVEFVTQFLQLVHGAEHREVRSINTLDALVRLADFGILAGDEYRKLSRGYVFLRTLEHALQLMHNKQTHQLPGDPSEQAYLARRLDYPDVEQFLEHYRQHCNEVRAVYERYLESEDGPPRGAGDEDEPAVEAVDRVADPRSEMEPSYSEIFSDGEVARHTELLARLAEDRPAEVDAVPLENGRWRVTVTGYDIRGDLSMICGLLFVYGFNIDDGQVFTAEQVAAEHAGRRGRRKFINVLTVQPPLDVVLPEVWDRYRSDLNDLLKQLKAGRYREAQGQLAKRVAAALRDIPGAESSLSPVEVEIDNGASDRYTVLHIRAEDTIGFLYELSNALTMSGIDIGRVVVSSVGDRVFDTLSVTDAEGRKITDADRLRELRAAVVLIKHFTHLLPRSPNPEAALLHFREFLEKLFQQEHWMDELASLERPDVLEVLARLLGVSDFLWEDFLRLQYANLFPVIKNVDDLEQAKSRETLERELGAELARADGPEEKRKLLNAFKDREMFRVDMRHIGGRIREFGQFSRELTDVAEVVVAAGTRICDQELRNRYGEPRRNDERPCRLSVCALGKCGGRELGYASDIELMFVHEGPGRTAGPDAITTAEYFVRLVKDFNRAIRTRREGIFEIDLRLRPYGRAGSLAVSLEAFRSYFEPGGPAWPYERQALVKLRPIAGDPEFGAEVARLRDGLIYTGEPFDAMAMRAMREKQVRQLVQAGTVNTKLSPGGLVDVEYLVQGLQMTYGHRDPALRATNTVQAMHALKDAGILAPEDHRQLQEAYIFLRRLIDALRVVRGHARDLTVPPPESEEFEFLARRLGYGGNLGQLQEDLRRHTRQVQELAGLLDEFGA